MYHFLFELVHDDEEQLCHFYMQDTVQQYQYNLMLIALNFYLKSKHVSYI